MGKGKVSVDRDMTIVRDTLDPPFHILLLLRVARHVLEAETIARHTDLDRIRVVPT